MMDLRALLRRAAAVLLLGLAAGCGGGSPAVQALAQALKAQPVSAADRALTGTWWNPFEPGTGFFFEAQGGLAVATFYVFEAEGRAVWYSGVGNMTSTAAGQEFRGTLQRHVGGQAGTSRTPKTPAASAFADVAILFSAAGAARVQLPGRSYTAYRFALSAAQLPSQPEGQRSAVQPETGIYWNPAESGRGYTIEMLNGIANVGVFHYDSSGQPVWNLVSAGLPVNATALGDFAAYRGGQTLAGAYTAPDRLADSSRFELRVLTACTAQIAFPGLPPVDVQRFSFNPAVDACGGSTGPPPPPDPGVAGVSFQAYAPATLSIASPVVALPAVTGIVGKATQYRVASGSLPPGLWVDATTGVISGYVAQPGTYSGEVGLQVTGLAGEARARFSFHVHGVTITGPTRVTAQVGEPFVTELRYTVLDALTGQPVVPGPGFGAFFSAPSRSDGAIASLGGGLYVDSGNGRVLGTPRSAFSGTTPLIATFGGPSGEIYKVTFQVETHIAPALTEPPPGSRYLDFVEVELVGSASLGGAVEAGSAPPASFQFRATGNLSLLEGGQLAIVVEDPQGLYQPGLAQVSIDESSATATVTLQPKPFAAAGRVQGYLRFFACLDSRCTLLLKPTPIVVRYDYTVH
ncbi:hypothetical protein FN976_26590 [Caenimonas sedimenti]|uniref:Dystroglycan-type cadherin-like domain-containing protein n=1 Tax=Caenimonas sedimenti TaxID=2596921 RepID=A0A562ZG42_9BURK|nr:putative Ig domain-containing protein [Caenimonas sedimenti]TWO66682.1 hypothetical protein FN976_26590 [Caenimonas sedimenti]